MVLTVSFALSPVTGFVATVAREACFSENLTPASGRQDHTTSPSAFVLARAKETRGLELEAMQ
jgi:hypothetical protein